jgi:hypothetical protein
MELDTSKRTNLGRKQALEQLCAEHLVLSDEQLYSRQNSCAFLRVTSAGNPNRFLKTFIKVC